MTYLSDGENGLENLDSGGLYYAIRGDAETIRLARSADDATDGVAIELTSLDESSDQFIQQTRQLGFDPAVEIDAGQGSITFGDAHGLASGANLVYRSDGNWRFKGLQNGQTYYAGVVDDYTIKLLKSEPETRIDNPTPVDIDYDVSAGGGGMSLQTIAGDIWLSSELDATLSAVAVSGQFAEKFAGGGSIAVNTVESAIGSGSVVISAQDLRLSADANRHGERSEGG
ncbi:MAG: hypothetical protein AB2814_00960 [Candidatus Sedimenticola endophacoides]